LKYYGVYIYWNRCVPLISQYSVIRGQYNERSGSERSKCNSSDYINSLYFINIKLKDSSFFYYIIKAKEIIINIKDKKDNYNNLNNNIISF